MRVERVGVADQAAVPGDTGLEVGAVRGIEPDDAAAPAEAGDPEPGGVAPPFRLGPGGGGVEVLHDLLVRHLGDHLADDLVDVGHGGDVALAGVEGRGHGEIARLGEAAADVLDVLVDAEDLLHDQHGRVRAGALRPGIVGRHVAVAHGDLGLAHLQALCVGADRGGTHRHDGAGEARGQRGDGEQAAREVEPRDEADLVGGQSVHAGPPLACAAPR